MTSPIADIIAKSHRSGAYVLFIEGLPYAFTDRSEIAGTGAFSWIGTAYGARSVIEGLTVPEAISYETSLENGMLSSEDGASFEIIDFEGKMIALIAEDNEGEVVGETLGPLVDPAPANILDATGLNNVALFGRWLNAEAIGPAGERRYYSCMPVTLPGLDHAAVHGDDQSLAPSIVRDAPMWSEGLRCALYFIYQDTDDDSWPSWKTQHDSGYSLVWYGATRELTCQALTWTLDCDGPSSWLRRQLGSNRSAEWRPVGSTLLLSSDPGNREDLAAYQLMYRRATDPDELGDSSFYQVADALSTTGQAWEYRTAINARITALSAGGAVPFNTYSATCTFYAGYVEVQIDASSNRAACAYVALHEKVWRTLGYDPRYQTAPPYDNSLAIHFTPCDQLDTWNAPAPNYFLGRFTTVPIGYNTLAEAQGDVDGAGKPRKWVAVHGEDMTTLYPEGDQEIRVGLGGGSLPYLEGQTCRAPTEHSMSNGGGEVDASAYVAFRGAYRNSADDEAKTMAQVAKAGFVDDTGNGGHGPSPDDDSYLRLHIVGYLSARFFGIDRKFTGPWSSLNLEWCPVNFIGYNHVYGDRADLVLLRTMLSTGTGYWSGYDGQGATRTLGSNAHPDADDPAGSDMEIADLGLQIHYSLIDATSFAETAAQLPDGGKDSGLAWCKYAYIGGFDSQEMIARIIEPRGWALGFVRGQFRLFNRAAPLDADDVEVTLTTDDFAVDDPQYIEVADLRPMYPRDSFTIEYGKPLVDDAGSELELVAKCRAIDPQSRQRRSNNDETIDGQGLVPVRLWGNDPAPPSWSSAWTALAGRDMATFYAAPWVTVEIPIKWSKARDLGPGSIVRLTSLFAPTRDGTYGLTGRLGRVTKWTLNTRELTAEVRILVQAGDPTTTPPRFAPIAQVQETATTVEARYDSATRKFYCYADHAGHGVDQSDVAWFAEPAWSGTGTDALVYGYQWDGREWAQTFEFTVESVDASAHTITYQAGTFTGTFWEARPCTLVLAPYDSQPANSWTKSVFGVITEDDGFFGAGTQGSKLV